MYRQVRMESSNTLRQKAMERLVILILIGLLIGVILMFRAPESGAWNSRFWNHGFAESLCERNVLSVFANALLPTALLLGACLVMGFCAVGQPGVLLVLLWRGMALGIAVAGTYRMQGMRGLPTVMFLQLPHALVTSLILVLAAREALRFSNQFWRFAWTERVEDGLRSQLKLYFLKFLVLLLILSGSAIVDSILTYCLTDMLLMAK